MTVISFPRPEENRAQRGVTLFLHIRKTTLIAHQNALRPAKLPLSQSVKRR